jgi:hypothetical protein
VRLESSGSRGGTIPRSASLAPSHHSDTQTTSGEYTVARRAYVRPAPALRKPPIFSRLLSPDLIRRLFAPSNPPGEVTVGRGRGGRRGSLDCRRAVLRLNAVNRCALLLPSFSPLQKPAHFHPAASARPLSLASALLFVSPALLRLYPLTSRVFLLFFRRLLVLRCFTASACFLFSSFALRSYALLRDTSSHVSIPAI